jgi:hypothetical protein
MDEEQTPKVSRVTIDLSTSVKPIAISDEDAIKKAKEDNLTQAQFKDDSIEEVETNVTKHMAEEEALTQESPETQAVNEAIKEANDMVNENLVNKTNDLLKGTDKETMNKQVVIVLAVIIAIIFLILIIELPSFIRTFK